MPVLKLKEDESASRILLAAGLGTVFGFQSWRLAEFGFGVPIPWYGSLWLFLGHVLLGFSIGVSKSGRWWKRGSVFGLVFSIPSAFGAYLLGLKWVPYGVASITASVVAGLLIAFIADTLFPRRAYSTDQRPPVSERPDGHASASAAPCPTTTVRQRLAEGKASLEHLDAERERRGDSRFGATTEDVVVWGELIELELQDIDEQVSRICGTAGLSPQAPMKSNLREGEPHKRNDS